jgi:hypothetical protein
LLRHFDSTSRDYNDHIGEISAKLLGMMDKELIGALEEVCGFIEKYLKIYFSGNWKEMCQLHHFNRL